MSLEKTRFGANLGPLKVAGDLAYEFDASANVERSHREVHWKMNSLDGRSERDRVSLTLDHEDQFSRTCMIFGVMSAFCRLYPNWHINSWLRDQGFLASPVCISCHISAVIRLFLSPGLALDRWRYTAPMLHR